jgi:hypothetical protein
MLVRVGVGGSWRCDETPSAVHGCRGAEARADPSVQSHPQSHGSVELPALFVDRPLLDTAVSAEMASLWMTRCKEQERG